MQVLGALATTFSIPYPRIYTTVMRWLSVLELNVIEIMPLACQGYTFNFHHSMLLRTVYPLAFGIFALALKALFRSWPKPNAIADRLVTAWFFLIFLVYPTTSQKVFNMFNCEEFDDGSRALMQDLSVDCDGPVHGTYTVIAWVMFAIYPFGVPLLYLYLLFWKHGVQISLLRANTDRHGKLRLESLAAIMHERLKARSANHEAALASFDARGKKGRRPAMPLVELPTDAELPEEVQAQLLALEEEHEAIFETLPDYAKKLLSSYVNTVFWFEIFEVRASAAITPAAWSPVHLLSGARAVPVDRGSACASSRSSACPSSSRRPARRPSSSSG